MGEKKEKGRKNKLQSQIELAIL